MAAGLAAGLVAGLAAGLAADLAAGLVTMASDYTWGGQATVGFTQLHYSVTEQLMSSLTSVVITKEPAQALDLGVPTSRVRWAHYCPCH